MPLGVQVRPAQPEDVDGLVDLCLAARSESSIGSQLCSDDRGAVAGQLGALATVPDGTVLVATHGSEVVGFLLGRTVGPNLFTDAIGFSVEALYVASDHRRRGTGHALMQEAAAIAAEVGAEQVYVAPLPGARGMQRFLVRLGFGPAATHRAASTTSLLRRLAPETGQVRRPRSIEELVARRRESRRRARLERTQVGPDSLAVGGTGTDGVPVADAGPAAVPVLRQRSSITTQVNRAVQTRRDVESSTTTS